MIDAFFELQGDHLNWLVVLAETGQLVIGDQFSFIDNDDTVADGFHFLQDMR